MTEQRQDAAQARGDETQSPKRFIVPAILLLASTGDEKSDEVLRQALTQLPPMSNVPANLVQPIRLRITNRMTG